MMREYRPTTKGALLGKEAGLDEIAQSFNPHSEIGDEFDEFIDLITTKYLSIYERERYEDLMNAITQEMFNSNADDDKREMLRGLELDPDTSKWYRTNGQSTDRLFSVEEHEEVFEASIDDRTILSGLAGYVIGNRHKNIPLLQKEQLGLYGFESITQARAFVGAYVVGMCVTNRANNVLNEPPFFKSNKNGVNLEVSVGGDMHGDFRITQTSSIDSRLVTPLGTYSEAGPVEKLTVAGYHSVEPQILLSMIKYVLSSEYIEGTKLFVEKLIEIAQDTANKSNHPKGVKLFADYGQDSMNYHAYELRAVAEGYATLEEILKREPYASFPYLPQSKTMFEISRQENGIFFRNRTIDEDEIAKGIQINRDNFDQLFSCLFIQTIKGLGRTSPAQLYELLQITKRQLSSLG